MSDLRSIVDRELERVEVHPFTLDAFHRRREQKRRNQRIRAGVVGIAVALIVVLIGASVVRSSSVPGNIHPSPSRHNAQLTISINGGIDVVDLKTGELRVLVADVGVSGFAWSPDGTELAYESKTHPCSLVIRNMETGADRVLGTKCGTPRFGASVDWSADGNWIAFAGPASGEPGGTVQPVMLIHPDGTGERQLTDPDGFPITASIGFSLSPDGSQIVFGSGAEIFTMNVDGTGRRLLAKGISPDWSVDGSSIAFEGYARLLHTNGDPFVWQAWSIRPDGSRLTEIHARKHCCIGLWATGPVWAPDGSQMAAVVRGQLRLIATDGGAVRTISSVTINSPSMLAWRPTP
ncbi:MAG: TolB family protein [Actinomycetota bacterium]